MSRIVFDLETFANRPTEESIEAYRREVSEELVQEKAIENRVRKYIEDGALDLERAKIIAVAFHDITTRETVSISSEDTSTIANFVLTTLNDWFTPATKLVGFNITTFDLPLLNILLAKQGLALPRKLKRFDYVDLMVEPFGKSFGRKSLDYYLRVFGLPAKTNSGKNVNSLWLSDVANGTKEVENYCRSDVEIEAELYRAFSRLYEI